MADDIGLLGTPSRVDQIFDITLLWSYTSWLREPPLLKALEHRISRARDPHRRPGVTTPGLLILWTPSHITLSAWWHRRKSTPCRGEARSRDGTRRGLEHPLPHPTTEFSMNNTQPPILRLEDEVQEARPDQDRQTITVRLLADGRRAAWCQYDIVITDRCSARDQEELVLFWRRPIDRRDQHPIMQLKLASDSTTEMILRAQCVQRARRHAAELLLTGRRVEARHQGERLELWSHGEVLTHLPLVRLADVDLRGAHPVGTLMGDVVLGDPEQSLHLQRREEGWRVSHDDGTSDEVKTVRCAWRHVDDLIWTAWR